MAPKDPRGKGSYMKTKACNLLGTGTELLWKVKGEVGKTTVLVWR